MEFVRRTRGPSVRRAVVDALLWFGLSLTVVVALTASESDGAWVVAGGVAVVAVAVSVARSRPLAAAGIVLLAGLLAGTALWESPFAVATAVMSYLAGRRASEVGPALRLLLVVVAAGTVLVAVRGPDVVTWLSLLASVAALAAFPWLVGRTVRQHRELARGGWERAEQLEREQRILEDQARLEERTRIAAEMHDALGHELSMLALRAGGLQVAADLPEHHRRAIAELREQAATATRRLGEIVGLLRGEEASTVPVNETVGQVVERVRRSGLTVRLDDEGGADGLDGPVGRTVHRVVQESLTNAAKHAPDAEVDVRIRQGPAVVSVSVSNGPSRTAVDQVATLGGRGLAALRERVRIMGGALRAGATGGGGFEVVAQLPRTPAAAAAGEVGCGPGDRAVRSQGSATAAVLVETRGRARRSLLLAAGFPLVAALVAVLAMAGYWAYEASTTVLEAETFDGLRVGRHEPQLLSMLPSREARPPGTSEPPAPEGATCRYYRSGRNLFVAQPIYRMCLEGGTVVSKHVLPAPSDQANR